MSKPLSLSFKLPVTILAAILLILSVGALFIMRTAEEVLTYVKSSRVEDASLAVGNSRGYSIAAFRKRYGVDRHHASCFGGGKAFHQPRLRLPRAKNKRKELTMMLNRIKASFGYYEEFYLLNEKGEPIAGVFDPDKNCALWRDSGWIKGVMNKQTFLVGAPYLCDKSEGILIPVALKVVSDGRSGVLVGSLELSKLSRSSIKESTRPGVSPLCCGFVGICYVGTQAQGGGGEEFLARSRGFHASGTMFRKPECA
jgi:hypothetical protein